MIYTNYMIALLYLDIIKINDLLTSFY